MIIHILIYKVGERVTYTGIISRKKNIKEENYEQNKHNQRNL